MRTKENPGGQTGASESTWRRDHRHTTATDHAMLAANDDLARQVQELEARAHELGFALSVRCLTCKRPLTDAKSVAAHRGPVCRGGANV